MSLSRLELSNFRNHARELFSFSPTITYVVGANTAGKTSLLEAIMLVATGKSFRASREKEVISFDEEVATIKLESQSDSQQADVLKIVVTGGSVLGKKSPYKRFLVNNVGKRGVDFVGRMPAVLFWPEDLLLITGSPSRRRQYLDTVLSQADTAYRRSLATYEKALRIRNKLLHQQREGMPIRPEEFEYWTETLLTHGERIHSARNAYIEYINTVSIEGTGDAAPQFKIHYDHSVISPERLEKYKQAEQGAAVTLVGPHRDDIFITKQHDKGRELREYGSRGEQRLGVLWLKIAELEYIQEQLEVKPLLLLDDIFSELDEEHRHLVTQLIGKQQTVMTTTEASSIDKSANAGIIHL